MLRTEPAKWRCLEAAAATPFLNAELNIVNFANKGRKNDFCGRLLPLAKVKNDWISADIFFLNLASRNCRQGVQKQDPEALRQIVRRNAFGPDFSTFESILRNLPAIRPAP